MNEDQRRLVMNFIHFIVESGQLSGDDNDFLKAQFYDFSKHIESLNKDDSNV